ncbi:hypothetical protein C9383_15800 [Pseudomonas palleroniana]|uniref:Uncharacterized protein n=1 Tax=Pseudomonas palleroniana TaxID=191390 RepID=A0A1H5LQ40_9PSED|nr:hypothetical protein [Pseudomonas palleroniana]KAB0566578.1 hypothetical protein F7R03_13445 [Pseudomonas palleroniana]PTC25564.1 hypothetical protein C9383_15800 [Pseudomonas palleroniana]SEE79176.1 hypothetical protein SAMN04490198_2865 [Pseudomonas palleroniana]
MNIRYTVNSEPGAMQLPATYLLVAKAEDLAELVASDFWRKHSNPPRSCEVHLEGVDGVDLGKFEVQSETRPVFTAKAVTQG